MLRVLATSSLALLLLAGCGADDDASPEAALPAAPPASAGTTAPTPSTETTTGTTTETTTGTASAAPSTPVGRRQVPVPSGRALLLEPAELPVLADAHPWVVTATTREDTDAVGICQRASLTDIGAVSAQRRTFANGHGEARGAATAVQVVAEFADRRSATRAHQVLESWWRDCAEHVEQPHHRIAALRPVTVAAGTARAYRATYGPRARAARHLEGLAFLHRGDTITVVRVEARAGAFAGPRANPARGAVKRLARRLG